jgi:hypothetical protein
MALKDDPRYWAVVKDCLILFYGYTETQASEMITALKTRLNSCGADFNPDIIYHAEAWHIAADLHGDESARCPKPATYREIWAKHRR